MQIWKCRQCGKEVKSYSEKPSGSTGGKCNHDRIIDYERQFKPNYSVPSNYTSHQWVPIENYDYDEFKKSSLDDLEVEERHARAWLRSGHELDDTWSEKVRKKLKAEGVRPGRKSSDINSTSNYNSEKEELREKQEIADLKANGQKFLVFNKEKPLLSGCLFFMALPFIFFIIGVRTFGNGSHNLIIPLIPIGLWVLLYLKSYFRGN
jgi:hypothetical protein